MSNKLRIAMIGQKGIPAVYGGVERHVEEIGSRLAARGHEVTVYVRPYYLKESGFSGARYKGMQIRTLPTVHSKHLDAIVHCFLSSLHALTCRYDIVHYHAIGPATVACIPRLKGTKVVATCHGLDWQRKKWNRFASLYLQYGQWASYHYSHETITVSRTLKEYYEKVYGGAVNYIPNGVTIPQTAPADSIRKEYGLEKDSYIVFISRLVPEKGCQYLIDAYKSLKTEKKLVIVGGSSHSDDYVEQLHQQAADDKRITFTGNVTGNILAQLFSNAYLFVLPSELEGLPIVILEALGFGKCVLASDIPENREVVDPAGGSDDRSKYGYTFRSKDVTDLTNQLDYLLKNPQAVEKMAARAQSYVGKYFNWDTVTDQTESLYYSLCKK